MFGTKRRTYGSKKSESGTIRPRDVLRAVPDTNLFDALSAINIKKYRKDNSYLFPNRLSGFPSVRSKLVKRTKRRNESIKIENLSQNSTSDDSLHVKHNSNDLFDQLKDSVTKNDEAFDNLMNGINVVATNQIDPRINLSTDSSSYSPAKQDSSKDSSFTLNTAKKKKSIKKQNTKKVLHLTSEGNTSHSLRNHNFVVEPNLKNTSHLVTPQVILSCDERKWNEFESSNNIFSSSADVIENQFKNSFGDSLINLDNEIFLPSSTPYGKIKRKSKEQDENSFEINSPMDCFLPKISNEKSYKNKLSIVDKPKFNIDHRVAIFSESDSDSSFHGFSSENLDGKPEPLCHGLSPPKMRRIVHSPDLFSCNSFDVSLYKEKDFSRLSNCDKTADDVKLTKMVPRVILTRCDSKITTDSIGVIKTKQSISSIYDSHVSEMNTNPSKLSEVYDEKLFKMVPIVLLTKLPNRYLNSNSKYSANIVPPDPKLNILIPRVVLNRISIIEMKLNISSENLKVSSGGDFNLNNLSSAASPMRLRNNKTVKNKGLKVNMKAKSINKPKRDSDFVNSSELNNCVPEKNNEISPLQEPSVVLKNDDDVYLQLSLDDDTSQTIEKDHSFVNHEVTAISNEVLNSFKSVDESLKNKTEESRKLEDTSNSFKSSLEDSFDQSVFDNTCMFVTKRSTRFTNFNKTNKLNNSVKSNDHNISSECNGLSFKPNRSDKFVIDNPMVNTTKRDTMYRKTIAPRPSIYLEHGKRWERSLNILRQMNQTNNVSINDSIYGGNGTMLNSTMKKGRMYNQSVAHLMEMQRLEGKPRDTFGDSMYHDYHDVLSNFSRRHSVMIVEEPTLKEEDFTGSESQISQSSLGSGLYEDSCNDTKINSSRVSLSESDRSKHLSVLLRREGNLKLGGEEEEDQWSGLTARDVVLRRCNQSQPLPFNECYPLQKLRKCWKIGEGVYGEVFLYKNEEEPCNPIVMKVIPIEGDLIVNGDRQKKFSEIISEIIIAMELSDLRNNKENSTHAFNKVNQVRCVQGRYPESLIDLWELYDEQKGSENDNPSIFDEEQLYIVLELANGGSDLEAFRFKDAEQSYHLFFQVAFALAVAEEVYQFEHRDLHWGNILVSNTDKPILKYTLRGEEYSVPSSDVQCCVIDYTLSRMTLPAAVTAHLPNAHSATTIYNDLSKDPDLFNADGDYQFDIYRLMKEKNSNLWQHFEPFTNILWLHYTLDKMIKALRYERTDTRLHEIYISKLSLLKDTILQYDSCVDFVTSEQCFSLLNNI